MRERTKDMEGTYCNEKENLKKDRKEGYRRENNRKARGVINETQRREQSRRKVENMKTGNKLWKERERKLENKLWKTENKLRKE